MDKSMEKVLGAIDEAEIIEFVESLVRIDTVVSEAPIIPLLEKTFTSMGLETEIYDARNPGSPGPKRPCILGTLPGRAKKPLLCFNGHTDVVPVEFPGKWTHPPFEPVIEGTKLFGRGVSDMKGGLGSQIMAAQAIVRAGIELNGSLVIAAVPGEETGGWGTESMVGRGDWDAAVIAEPTSLSVCPACNGITTFAVKVTGRAAHASTPERGVNAIDKMLVILNAFEAYKGKLEGRAHPLTGTPAFVSCVLRGGWRNVIVADECSLSITTHLVPGETTESRFTEVIEILETLKSRDPDLKCEMTDWEGKPFTLPLPKNGPRRPRLDPTEISVEEPIVQAMLGAAADSLGRKLPLGGVRYACDSPYFVNERRVPTVVFGPGSIEQAHTDDEWIETAQLVEATKVFAAGAMKFLGYR